MKYSNGFKKILVVLFLVFSFFCLFSVAKATGPVKDPLGLNYGAETKLADQDIRITIARIITVALGLLGTIALILIIYAGFKWMLSGGNEEEAKDARKILFAAVIGLAIILSAYSISKFILTNLYQATQGTSYQAE